MNKILLWLVILVAVAALGPLLVIWSLNTLFAFTIPFTIETWSAVIILGMFLKGDGVVHAMFQLEAFAALVASAEREAILAVIGDNQCECRCSEVVRDRGQA